MTREAIPATTNDIARVAISELILKKVETTPLASPTTTPMSTPAMIASVGFQPWAASSPNTTEAEAVDRAHREVDATGDQHERAGDGDHKRRRLLIDDVQQIRLGQERRGADRQRDEEDEEGDQDPGAAPRDGESLPQVSCLRRGPRVRGSRCLLRAAPGAHLLIGAHAASSVIFVSENAAARIADSLISSARQLLDDTSTAHHEHALGQAEHLLISGGDEQHRRYPQPQAQRSGRRSRAWRRRRLHAWARRRSAPWAGTSASARTAPSAGFHRTTSRRSIRRYRE